MLPACKILDEATEWAWEGVSEGGSEGGIRWRWVLKVESEGKIEARRKHWRKGTWKYFLSGGIKCIVRECDDEEGEGRDRLGSGRIKGRSFSEYSITLKSKGNLWKA